MADQDWKTCGLNQQKYVVLKLCPTCNGSGIYVQTVEGPIGCENCSGTGTVKSRDKNARYFVLRIDCGPDGAYDPNARSALAWYAKSVRGDNPKLASDIVRWLDKTYVDGVVI